MAHRGHLCTVKNRLDALCPVAFRLSLLRRSVGVAGIALAKEWHACATQYPDCVARGILRGTAMASAIDGVFWRW